MAFLNNEAPGFPLISVILSTNSIKSVAKLGDAAAAALVLLDYLQQPQAYAVHIQQRACAAY